MDCVCASYTLACSLLITRQQAKRLPAVAHGLTKFINRISAAPPDERFSKHGDLDNPKHWINPTMLSPRKQTNCFPAIYSLARLVTFRPASFPEWAQPFTKVMPKSRSGVHKQVPPTPRICAALVRVNPRIA